MFIYSFLHYYNVQRQNFKKLTRDLSDLEPHRVVSRRRGRKTYYFEVRLKNGKRHERCISREEYLKLARENFRFNAAKKDFEECDKFLTRNRDLAEHYSEIIGDRAFFLENHAPDTPETGTPFLEEGKIFHTQRGEDVRSKSEQTIADVLFQYHIEYEYESDFSISGFRPDFIIWDSIRGMPVIWEHLGKLTDYKYVSDTLSKLKAYERAGFYINYNLILTFEFYSNNPNVTAHYFDSNKAKEIVEKWFMP